MRNALLKISALVIVTLVLTAGFAALISAQQAQIRTPRQTMFYVNPDFSKMEVQTLHVQGNIYLLAGAGGNIAVQTGDDGVLMVDTGYEKMSDKILAAIRKLSKLPIRDIINTTLADDHTGGNAIFVKAGSVNQAGPGLGGRPNEADLIANGDLLRLMTEIGPDKISVDRWPPKTFLTQSMDFYSNDEPVIIKHVPAANTAGDSYVWFRRSDVIAAGEIFNETSYPYIDLEHGGSINGIIEGLNQLLEITVPKHLQEGGTMVIPGHGRIGDEHDVLEYRDMVTIVRDRVKNAISKKMTLAQVKAAKPSYTYDYDLRFGKNPSWTPDQFVEAIYKSLSK
ncbi:MAG TPA: MBL fold metallo-hydrolase [Terriglobia bacterium]|nr:MBL fold metallo-hydrolase [Terriglobia bacterium]